MASKIKLKTIAEKANVSISTASRVMTNKGYVSPEARERVLNVLGELTDKKIRSPADYKLRVLKVAVVISVDEFIDDDPETSVDVSTIQKEIESDGHYVELLQRKINAPEEEQSLFKKLETFDIAILYDPAVEDPILPFLREKNIPMLQTNGFSPDSEYYVDYDNYHGATAAVSYLLDMGHRHIGFIAGFPDRYVTVNRLDACRAVMSERGFQWDDSRVEPGFFKLNGGYNACKNLMARHPDTTAVFALNDLSAIGAVRALKDLGKRVPEDVSVVGFDDMEIANYSDPPLTTVSRFSSEYNAVLTNVLNDLGKYESIGHIGILLKTELIVRDSVASVS